MRLNILIKHFTLAGAEVFYVGGYVRDKVLSKYHPEYTFEPKDIDLEIYRLYPEEVMKILDIFQIPYSYVGTTFPVIKFTIEGKEIEVAFPRREISTGDKHKDFKVEIDPYMDKKEASRRRDFSCNAILMRPDGSTLDYFGGLDSIKSRKLLATDKETFKEDPLRVLRAYRFLAKFNSKGVGFSLKIPVSYLKSINIFNLPEERICEEIFKIHELDYKLVKKLFKDLFEVETQGKFLSTIVYTSGMKKEYFLNRSCDLKQYALMEKFQKAKSKKEIFLIILRHISKYKKNAFNSDFFKEALRVTTKLTKKEVKLFSEIKLGDFTSRKELYLKGISTENLQKELERKAFKQFFEKLANK